MNELSKITTMSSREIAELAERRHDNVLAAIREMEPAWEKVTDLKFKVSEYSDSTGRKLPMYELSKKECLYIASKFNDEVRAKLIVRWEELEKEKMTGNFQIPQSFSEALKLAANQAEQIEHQQKQLAAQAPKVLFADAVTTSDRSVLVSELAKILKQNGIEIGQNRLFIWLREKGYLCSKGEYYNQPTQRAMQLGLFELKKTTINKPDGTVLTTTTTKVSGKGQVYFVDRFLSKIKEAV